MSSEGSFERELKGGDKKEFKLKKPKRNREKRERMAKRKGKRRRKKSWWF